MEPWLYYFHVPTAEGREGMSGLGLFQYDLAIKLEAQLPVNSTADLMCRLIEGDSDYFFQHVRSPVFAGTRMQRYYLKEVAKLEAAYKSMWGHIAVFTGVWLPPSKVSSTIGPKLLLGGALGFMKGRSTVDGVMALRFFNARHGYVVDDGGDLRSTSRFMGLYLGGEYGFRVVRPGRLESELVGGFGYDGINTGMPDGDEHVDYINSVNFNFGARLRLFADRYRDRYIGLSARYHFVNYGNGAGTAFAGNTITIRLILGWMNNGKFQSRAKELHYYDDDYPRLPASDGVAMQ